MEGIKNLDKILTVADGIHVSRGDLGMHIDLEKIALAQKYIIFKAQVAGKPVVTSTQMLNSMICNHKPTLAEISDVANCAIDGTDAVMLSGETAKGKNPVNCIKTMDTILSEARNVIDNCLLYNRLTSYNKTNNIHFNEAYNSFAAKIHTDHVNYEAIAAATVETAINLSAKLIVVDQTHSDKGELCLFTSKYRPNAKIFAITMNKKCANQLEGMCYGVKTIVIQDGEYPILPSNVPLLHRIVLLTKDTAYCIGNGDIIVCLFQECSLQKLPSKNHVSINKSQFNKKDNLGFKNSKIPATYVQRVITIGKDAF